MHPFIPGGSRLTVQAYDGRPLSVGDVVAYPDQQGLVAHRVVAVEGTAPDQRLRVCGDAAGFNSQAIDADGVAFVVLDVECRGIRYALDGTVGQLIARVAMRGGVSLVAAGNLIRMLGRILPR